MHIRINTSDHPNQTLAVQLKGQPVRIGLKYSSVGDCWFLSLTSTEDDHLSMGRRIRSGVYILSPAPSGFLGNLVAIPTTKVEQQVTRDCWNKTHTLYYIDPDEL